MGWQDYYRGRLLTEHEVEATWKINHLDREVSLDEIKGQLLSIAGILVRGRSVCCQRCHNQDKNRFYPLPDGRNCYCLNCIQMGRVTTQDLLYFLKASDFYRPRKTCLTWNGSLSDQQEKASQQAIHSLNDCQRPHLIHAVTGAGKTEMLFAVMDHVLMRGGRVAIASPRIDVCLELAPRIRSAFSGLDLCLLYGGSKERYLPQPILILTTHQLLRFKQAFDLLIVDEVDAFPYVNSDSLHFAVNRSIKDQGKLIFLTATPDDVLKKAIKQGKVTHTLLPARFHGYPLPEVRMVWIGRWQQAIEKEQMDSLLLAELVKFIQLEGVCLIFMANIAYAEKLSAWLSRLFPDDSIRSVHAQDPYREAKVCDVRLGKIQILITTTILERGVTFENCHVFVLGAEDPLFNRASLVQMSGRVGRKEKFPTGVLIYGHYGITRAMKEAAKEIKQMNQLARTAGLLKG